jgi:molybdopterin converting factor small subunit
VEIRLKLFPPLSDTAGTSELKLVLEDRATLGALVETLVARYGNQMRQNLFDTEGRIIPSWAVFLNQRIVPLNQPGALETAIHPQEEVSFILNIAGG